MHDETLRSPDKPQNSPIWTDPKGMALPKARVPVRRAEFGSCFVSIRPDLTEFRLFIHKVG